ncbi:hypothetical protein CWI80_04760 [Pseudidiomarina sediminum]|uniref:SCP domain-containing protein n=1 Tax=Pseudidiomarina sediminum TaxID=431675 RepID=A0A432Z9M9_9GAMM|nr:hypothetical protein [Pseudidiomarina sediminum]RUO74655.1 hypothetical protein CWI80_04760 [Pseudidiomarina sediminum]
MKTRTTIACICASIAALFTATASATTQETEHAERQPEVQAQQVYTYVYRPENYVGSIEHNLELAQASIMHNLRNDTRSASRRDLLRSHNELRAAAQLAAVSEMLPDRFFSGASDTLSRAN